MRILQIIDLPYESPVSGADIRNEVLLRGLRQCGQASQMAAATAQGNGVDPDRLAAILSEAPDVVVVEGVALLGWARALREHLPAKTRIVIDFHNVESALLEAQDRARLPGPLRPLAPLVFGRRWAEAKRLDREAIALADAIWTCSRRDEATALSLAGSGINSVVIPNPVPLWCGEFRAEPAMAPQRPRILFIGHLGYPPNKAAVRRLAGSIMPRVLRRFPEARLTVAGRRPNARLKALADKSPFADLVPDPADLAPHYRAADMVLLPLSEGGGSRIKVLEALAIGLPVVATAKATEGLDLEPGRHYLAAETPEDFAAAVERLVREPDLAERLRKEGSAFVEAAHGPDAIAADVRAALDALDQV